MNRKNLLKTLALVACLMCSLGAAAAEAYVCYTPENTTLTFYYDEYRSSRTGTTYDLNEGNNHPGWRDDGTCVSVTQVVFDPAFADVRPTSASNWFSDMINLEDISGLDYLNTSEVTDMSYMFSNCCKLTGGSDFLSTLETENVTSMAYMFFNCCDLEDINLRNFNTQRVTNMSSVFKFCSKLTTLDVSSFDTYFVQQMQYMFMAAAD
jgi:surface protein